MVETCSLDPICLSCLNPCQTKARIKYHLLKDLYEMGCFIPKRSTYIRHRLQKEPYTLFLKPSMYRCTKKNIYPKPTVYSCTLNRCTRGLPQQLLHQPRHCLAISLTRKLLCGHTHHLTHVLHTCSACIVNDLLYNWLKLFCA